MQLVVQAALVMAPCLIKASGSCPLLKAPVKAVHRGFPHGIPSRERFPQGEVSL